MSRRRKKKSAKSVLELPELDHAKAEVLSSLSSVESQRTYRHSMDRFIEWYCSEPRLAFNRSVVMRYKGHLEQQHYAPTTINLHLAAVRRLAYEAADEGLLSAELAAGIRRVKGARCIGVRRGNWLTAEESRAVLDSPSADTVRGKRNRGLLAVLLGCGLRRTEATRLRFRDIQRREGRWVISDLMGKGGHVRTVPIPAWVKVHIDEWRKAANIRKGRIFRAVNKAGRVHGRGISPKVVWQVVREAGIKIGVENLAPHDLRRTCARLCHRNGGELDQIRFLLGHVSIQTTERYLGCEQRLQEAVNDHIGLESSVPRMPPIPQSGPGLVNLPVC
jgi:integrase